MEFNKVLDKISKLMNLANDKGATESEAKVAYLKAQELLAEYNATMDDVEGRAGLPKRKVVMQQATHKWNAKWRASLAAVIAPNFRCKHFFMGMQTITFYGYEEDVSVAVNVFNSAYEVIYKKARQHEAAALKDYGTSRGVITTYALGFIHGFKEALEQQSVALMVVVPKEVQDEYDEYSKDFGKKSTSYRTNGDSRLAAQAKADGREFGTKKGIEA